MQWNSRSGQIRGNLIKTFYHALLKYMCFFLPRSSWFSLAPFLGDFVHAESLSPAHAIGDRISPLTYTLKQGLSTLSFFYPCFAENQHVSPFLLQPSEFLLLSTPSILPESFWSLSILNVLSGSFGNFQNHCWLDKSRIKSINQTHSTLSKGKRSDNHPRPSQVNASLYNKHW